MIIGSSSTQGKASLLAALLVSQLAVESYGFSNSPQPFFGYRALAAQHSRHSSQLFASTPRRDRAPSQVDDADPLTPPYEGDPIPIIDANTILPDVMYNRSQHSVPDQPWRRGDTDGCHDDIYAGWRVEAESIIRDACEHVGAELHGITWGMSQLMVSIKDVSAVEGIIDGPEIVVDNGADYNPALGPDLHWNPTMDQDEFEEYIENHPRSVVMRMDDPVNDGIYEEVDTMAISAVAEAIIESLKPEEERLQILTRHELMITAPTGVPGLLETQKEFDDHRGYHVKVETRDPWKSNRTLKGKLVARTALDILIEVNERVITIPQNFVYTTTLDDDYLEYEEDQE